MVVLPGTGTEVASERAERFRARAAALTRSAVPVTASAGVATFPRHADDGATLLDPADRALYVANPVTDQARHPCSSTRWRL